MFVEGLEQTVFIFRSTFRNGHKVSQVLSMIFVTDSVMPIMPEQVIFMHTIDGKRSAQVKKKYEIKRLSLRKSTA